MDHIGVYYPRPKVVQVIQVFNDMGILIVNDKKNSVAVMLSESCVSDFMEMYMKPISTLVNCLIKLEKWHFSTVIQCQRHDRDIKAMSVNCGIMLPIAISCSRITTLGAFDCVTIGDPVNINKVCRIMSPSLYLTIVSLRPGSCCTGMLAEINLYYSSGFVSGSSVP